MPSGEYLWPRLRLDIRLADLVFALRACLRPAAATEASVQQAWGGGDATACSSVCSAFDLVLQALPPGDGDEVVFSALTHPDMVRIAEAHQLKPIPIDIDLETLAPQTHLLERVISSRTRVVVVAHLFGTRIDLSAIAAQARRAGALVVEDSAQCFRGPGGGRRHLGRCFSLQFWPYQDSDGARWRNRRGQRSSAVTAHARDRSVLAPAVAMDVPPARSSLRRIARTYKPADLPAP